ncbi:MAG TPA: pantoate--beta-alanine ligase, partial [Pyrinomonadaceae bacterium]
QAQTLYAEGERSASRLVDLVRSTVGNEPLARIDYVSVNDAVTLEKIDKLGDGTALLSLAVFIGKTRLIDNVVLGSHKNAAVA